MEMTATELKDYILKHMSAEEALLKLLEGQLMEYKEIKFKNDEAMHPLLLISMAAMEMGWLLAIPKKGDINNEVIGLTVGTQEYINSILSEDDNNHEVFEDGE